MSGTPHYHPASQIRISGSPLAPLVWPRLGRRQILAPSAGRHRAKQATAFWAPTARAAARRRCWGSASGAADNLHWAKPAEAPPAAVIGRGGCGGCWGLRPHRAPQLSPVATGTGGGTGDHQNWKGPSGSERALACTDVGDHSGPRRRPPRPFVRDPQPGTAWRTTLRSPTAGARTGARSEARSCLGQTAVLPQVNALDHCGASRRVAAQC